MRKSTKFSVLLFTLCISLCGCKNSDNLSAPPSSAAEISDPFGGISNGDDSLSSVDSNIDKEDSEKNAKRIEELYSRIRGFNTWFYEDKAEWVDDETVKMPVRLELDGDLETEFCPFVLCDGMMVQTSMDGENFGYSDSRIHFAEMTDNMDNVTHEIYFKPVFDKSLSTHYVTVGYIINPDERPDDYWMVSNMLIQADASLGLAPLDISEHENVCVDMENVLKAEDPVPLTEETSKKYEVPLNVAGDANEQRTNLDITDPADSQTFSQEGKHQYNIMLAKGSDKINLSVVSATNTPQKIPYRVMFYVNCKPVKFNGKYDYLDVMLEGGKISLTDIELKGIKDKDIVYASFTPLTKVTGFECAATNVVHLVEEQKN